MNNSHIKIETGIEQALKPSINNINLLNKKHSVDEQEKSFFASEEKKNPKSSDASQEVKIPPIFSEVKLYFEEKDFPLEQAEKFFNHYESNGWLIGGKIKMRNWQAAARNWMLNSTKFDSITNRAQNQNLKSNHLHATTDKSYRDEL